MQSVDVMTTSSPQKTESTARPLDFLLIGVPRAGTTSLFHYLRAHPQVYMPLEKEVPYFSWDDRFERGWDVFFSEYFAKAPADALIGKMTPQYWGQQKVLDRLKATMPDVRLLVVFRNPVDRALSHYRLSFRDHAELPPFEEAIRDNSEYVDLGRYGTHYENLLQSFPQEQVLPLFTDDFDQPDQVIDRVLEFLGLPTGYRPGNLGKRYNRSGGAQRFPWLVAAVRNNPVLRTMWRAIPKRRRRIIKAIYNSELSVHKDELPPIPQDVRERLVADYLPEMRRLEQLIGRQVPWEELRAEESTSASDC